MHLRITHAALLLLIIGILAFLLGKQKFEKPGQVLPASPEITNAASEKKFSRASSPNDRKKRNPSSQHLDLAAMELGALPDQRMLAFASLAEMEDFRRRAGNRVTWLDQIDGLAVARIRINSGDDLSDLLGASQELEFIFPVKTPDVYQGGIQTGAEPVGIHLLEMLGLNENSPGTGKGVKIAILDTGIIAHDGLGKIISSINLVPLPADPAKINPHGTAVASMIFGKNFPALGIAPGAQGISIRIANDDGLSDSFTLANGIMEAIKQRADIIHISMGSSSDSSVVSQAVAAARKANIMIVAAAGNDGGKQIAYPAANAGVIAVGAVDAKNNPMAFSNQGPAMSIAAPGYGNLAAMPGQKFASVTGTSFSAPVVTGAVARAMDVYQAPSEESYNRIAKTANDGQQAGWDPQLGYGTVDLGRVFRAETPGHYDAAIASIHLTKNGKEVEYLVQNRGTEALINTTLTVDTPRGTFSSNITQLAPGGTHTVRVPYSGAAQSNSNTSTYSGRVRLSGNHLDQFSSNDFRQFSPQP